MTGTSFASIVALALGLAMDATAAAAAAPVLHQAADRGLVAALGEVADVILERPREPDANVGPRQMLHGHAAAHAVDALRAVTEVQLHPCRVHVPPLAILGSVIAGTVVPAARAPGLAPCRRDVDHETIVGEDAVDDAGVFQPEQLVE